MKRLKPHPHVIKLLGCVTETGGLVLYCLFGAWIIQDHYHLHVFQRRCILGFFNTCPAYQDAYLPDIEQKYYQSIIRISVVYIYFFSTTEPIMVIIEYVPYGDLLGYLRKSRGLNDTYYKDPDVKPRTNLTSQQLIKFAWQVADGMKYLSNKKVGYNFEAKLKSTMKAFTINANMF